MSEKDLKIKQKLGKFLFDMGIRIPLHLESQLDELVRFVNSEADELRRSSDKTNEELAERRTKLYVIFSEWFRNTSYPTEQAIQDVEKLF